MKMLETKQEIAIAINMHEMPVVRIDLAEAVEVMRGRVYVRGSIKAYREAK